MAITVAFDGTRLHTADVEGLSTDPTAGAWTDLTGGKCSTEPDFIYQGAGACSEKIGTTAGGVGVEFTAATDYTTPKVWIAKVIATNYGALEDKATPGMVLEMGSGGLRGDYDRYYVAGADTYPIKGGWLIIPIDPNGGNFSNRPGTAPTLTAIDYCGLECDFVSASKVENVVCDAVDYVTNGTGLTLTGNTPDGTFQDFIDADEGNSTNRWGIIATLEGVLYVTGVLTIGTATETDFTDAFQQIIFPDAEFLNSTGFFGLNLGLQNASSVIAVTSCVFVSRGTVGGTVDTRAVYIVTGTSGAGEYIGCTFDTFLSFTGTSALTLTSCIFLNGLLIDQSGATFDGCTFSGATTGDGVGHLLADDPGLIADCEFTFSDGHAIEIDTPGTYDFDGNVFNGYGADGTNDAAIYNNSGGLVTLNIANALTPTVRNGGGASTVINNFVDYVIEGLIAGSEVRIFTRPGGVELDGVESSGTSFTYQYNYVSDVDIFVIIQNVNYVWRRVDDTLTVDDKTIPANQVPDPNYLNP